MYSLIIADDEDITRMALSGYIRKTQPDFQVAGAFSNGIDALNYIHDNPVQLVITDIRMPGMDGLELARHISEQYPGISVIIISGYSEFEYARRAISYGVSNYLLKPLDFAELAQNLHQLKERLDALHMEEDCREEEIQLFFTDLIGGMLNQKEELVERFNRLSLPGERKEYQGLLLTITLEKNDALSQWKYGREKLAVALLNALRMALPQYQIFHLFRSGMRYYFVILSRGSAPECSLEMLDGVLYHLLQFSCELQIQSAFSSIDELGSFPPVKEDGLVDHKPAAGNDDIIIQKAMSYIQAHYAEDLTREDVADAVFLSSAYFSRFFKQKTGLNFIDYLTTVRMQKAAQLLGTHMKVGDIAKKVGYQSRNRFFINFRQYSGYNPTEYRRQILRMEDTHDENEE